MSIREVARHWLPTYVKDTLKAHLLAPPEEDVVLHDYQVQFESSTRRRLSLIIPTVASDKAFGGVMTGVELFLQIGQRADADLRIILDDQGSSVDTSLLASRTPGSQFKPNKIEIVQRTEVPVLGVRSSDLFLTFNWWATLNILPVLRLQSEHFQQPPIPFLYLIQEYEPHFYPFSTAHMLARLAFDPPWICWGIFNSTLLLDYFKLQGHHLERTFVFEPKLSNALRPFLPKADVRKEKRLVVYGRPHAPRNCFSAVQKGVTRWAQRYPEYVDWEVLSVGLPHRPVSLGDGRTMRSVGKLAVEAYGELLRTTAVGLSLMSSPHPSYPPLEMAHFGAFAITNRYANKDLSLAHDNILSIPDIRSDTIADAIAAACKKFETAPHAGVFGKTHMESFLVPGPFDCVNELSEALESGPWSRPRS